MELSASVLQCLTEIERHGGKPLAERYAVALILQTVYQTLMAAEFEELLFQSKFLFQAQRLYKRNASSPELVGKLSEESVKALSAIRSLLATFSQRLPEEEQERIRKDYLTIQQESEQALLRLVSDFSQVKNYALDGGAFPFALPRFRKDQNTVSVSEKHPHRPTILGYSYLFRASVVMGLLFLVFLLLEPPVSTFGWLFALLILLLLTFITIESFRGMRYDETTK